MACPAQLHRNVSKWLGNRSWEAKDCVDGLWRDELARFEAGQQHWSKCHSQGYYREAIGSFTASYERFLVFITRILVKASGTSDEEYEKAWKRIHNQSEPQLGAFTFVFLLTYQESPVLLSEEQVSLRNDVIHKGTIPTRTDCVKYGDDIMKIILSFLRRFWQSHQQEVIMSIHSKMFGDNSQRPMRIFLPWMTLPTNREPPTEGNYPSLEALLKGGGQAGGQG